MSEDFKDDIHLLCVEDDEMNQTIVKMLLQKLGYKKISVAGDSIEATSLLEKSDTDINVILMDLGLPAPGISGIELTKKIRQSQWKVKNIPIIALTGNSEAVAKTESLAAGMNDFLTKPIDAEKLRITLEKFLAEK
jgi:CheY-like chemotaxis protein